MKLRVRNNSVRLRLTQSEVARFGEIGRVEETIEFGLTTGKRLTYALETSDGEAVKADFSSGRITIFVPRRQAVAWLESSQLGIEAVQNIGGGKTLKILIEKDFACTRRRDGEDDRDAFPHPDQNKTC